MNLLFTLNENYLPPLYTVLRSIFYSNSKEKFTVYIMHQSISEQKLEDLQQFITKNGHIFCPIDCKNLFTEEIFVNRYYSIEMYYRLLAPFVLPAELIDFCILTLISLIYVHFQHFMNKILKASYL